jgi:CheY-like chemotaxis protein/two-component sensor histidine kinase
MEKTVLIVDDSESNIDILVELLAPTYEVVVSMDGENALEMANELEIDIILLDIVMPGMDGYEVCGELKTNPKTKEIPILFITAKSDDESIAKAYEVGGVDYVTKPFRPKELRARLETHLNLRQVHHELQEKLALLQSTQTKLVESEKMASLGNLVAGISHEINTPIGTAYTTATVLNDLFKSEPLDEAKALKKAVRGIPLILSNIERASQLIQKFKRISVDQHTDTVKEINITQYLKDLVESLHYEYSHHGHSVQVNSNDEIVINTAAGSVGQVFTNLIMSSIKHGFKALEGETITIDITQTAYDIAIDYKDSGKGIALEHQSKIFDPFFTTDKQDGTGLGLHIVYNLISHKLQGDIELIPSEAGVHFRLKFPKKLV